MRVPRAADLRRGPLTAVWTSSSSYLVALAATERREVVAQSADFFMRRAMVWGFFFL